MATNSNGVLAKRENGELATGHDVEALMLRGDISTLSPEEKAQWAVALCRSLGMNPLTQPIEWIRFQGKEIPYFKRGATDQLARMHHVNRKILAPPKMVDVNGKKVWYVECEATLPDGRSEYDVATLAPKDSEIDLMKVVTKAKRRATLSILGLGMLDESELDAMHGAVRVNVAARTAGELPANTDRPITGEHEAATPTPLDMLRDDLCSVETREQLRTVWHEHRAAIAAMDAAGEDASLRAARQLMWECASSHGLAATKKELAAILNGDAPKPPPDGGGAPKPEAQASDDVERAAIQEADSIAGAVAKAAITAATQAQPGATWSEKIAKLRARQHALNLWSKHRKEFGQDRAAKLAELVHAMVAREYAAGPKDAYAMLGELAAFPGHSEAA